MQLRPGLLALPLLLVLAPASAGASAGAHCRLVTDPAGDQQPPLPGTAAVAGPQSELDIRSADVANNSRDLTAAIRVTKLRLPTTTSAYGLAYSFLFTVNETEYLLDAVATTDGGRDATLFYRTRSVHEAGAGATSYEGVAKIRAVFDVALSEVRITAPLKVFAPQPVHNRQQLRSLGVETYTFAGNGPRALDLPSGQAGSVGSGGVGSAADVASTTRTYVTGSPSCLQVGR